MRWPKIFRKGEQKGTRQNAAGVKPAEPANVPPNAPVSDSDALEGLAVLNADRGQKGGALEQVVQSSSPIYFLSKKDEDSTNYYFGYVLPKNVDEKSIDLLARL